jgi:hypothetical protein
MIGQGRIVIDLDSEDVRVVCIHDGMSVLRYHLLMKHMSAKVYAMLRCSACCCYLWQLLDDEQGRCRRFGCILCLTIERWVCF